ncbi:MAG: hypothetical protein ACTS6J_23810 [Burkholderiales bacterium]
MMDFLRRLAPLRETDTSRAVAVLPSRFDAGSPLQAAIGEAGPVQRIEDRDLSLQGDTVPASDGERKPVQHPARTRSARHEAPGALTAQSRSLPEDLPPDASLPVPRELRLRGERQGAPRASRSPDASPPEAGEMPLLHAGRDAPQASRSPARHGPGDLDAASPLRAVPQRAQAGERAVNTAPSTVDADVAASAVFANQGKRSSAMPAGAARVASPLSEASLAQRAGHARDENSVVHVTIGRIEVVANVVPATTARRSPATRPPTVALSDYLRGRGGVRG